MSRSPRAHLVGGAAVHSTWFQLQWDIHAAPAHHNKRAAIDCYGGGHLGKQVGGPHHPGKLWQHGSCPGSQVPPIKRSHSYAPPQVPGTSQVLVSVLANKQTHPGKTQFASTHTVQNQPLILSFQLPTGQSFTYSPSTTPLLNSCAAETRLDLRQLGESVREYYIQGLAPSTVKSYASAKSCFVQFCHNINQSCIHIWNITMPLCVASS